MQWCRLSIAVAWFSVAVDTIMMLWSQVWWFSSPLQNTAMEPPGFSFGPESGLAIAKMPVRRVLHLKSPTRLLQLKAAGYRGLESLLACWLATTTSTGDHSSDRPTLLGPLCRPGPRCRRPSAACLLACAHRHRRPRPKRSVPTAGLPAQAGYAMLLSAVGSENGEGWGPAMAPGYPTALHRC